MKLKALLSVLLIVALLLSPVALMEETIEQKVEPDGGASMEGIIEEAPENGDNAASNDTEEHVPEGEILSENVDETVPEDKDDELTADVAVPEEDFSELPEDEEGIIENNEMSEYVGEAAEFQRAFGEAALSALYAGAFGVSVNASNFPDAMFRKFVSDKYDVNPKDGVLSDAEIAAVTEMDVFDGDDFTNHKPIASLQGIGYFTMLSTLECDMCELTSLDVSQNTQLQVLSCASNRITQLNVSGCPNLMDINCMGNPLTTLDISNCPVLCTALKGNVFKDENSNKTYVNPYTGATLECEATLKIITTKTTTSDANTSVDSTPTDTPTIAATKKSNKTTITAVPGTVYQLDLGGTTGKKFRSSKKKVATVSSTGLVTIKAAGKVKITFKVGKKKRTVTIKIVDPTVPTSISLNMSGTNAVKTGDSVTLTVVLPEGTNSGIKWKSSNKRVATVKNGMVTFKKAGKATITAITSRGRKKARVKFKVKKYDAKKDLSNYEYRTVQERGRGRLVFQKSPKAKAAFMRKHYFHTGDQILVNVNWRKNGFAIAYDKGTYGYVNASYIAW